MHTYIVKKKNLSAVAAVSAWKAAGVVGVASRSASHFAPQPVAADVAVVAVVAAVAPVAAVVADDMTAVVAAVAAHVSHLAAAVAAAVAPRLRRHAHLVAPLSRV